MREVKSPESVDERREDNEGVDRSIVFWSIGGRRGWMYMLYRVVRWEINGGREEGEEVGWGAMVDGVCGLDGGREEDGESGGRKRRER